jgi:hypothetical protein
MEKYWSVIAIKPLIILDFVTVFCFVFIILQDIIPVMSEIFLVAFSQNCTKFETFGTSD